MCYSIHNVCTFLQFETSTISLTIWLLDILFIHLELWFWKSWFSFPQLFVLCRESVCQLMPPPSLLSSLLPRCAALDHRQRCAQWFSIWDSNISNHFIIMLSNVWHVYARDFLSFALLKPLSFSGFLFYVWTCINTFIHHHNHQKHRVDEFILSVVRFYCFYYVYIHFLLQ